jgi:hypothetical protein
MPFRIHVRPRRRGEFLLDSRRAFEIARQPYRSLRAFRCWVLSTCAITLDSTGNATVTDVQYETNQRWESPVLTTAQSRPSLRFPFTVSLWRQAMSRVYQKGPYSRWRLANPGSLSRRWNRHRPWGAPARRARRALGKGMRERAAHISGQLKVWSGSGIGKEARRVDLIRKTDVPRQTTRQTPIWQRSHRELRRLLRPAD